MIFGLGAALSRADPRSRTASSSSRNFNDYQVMRMTDVPPMDVKVISTDDQPTGIGEVGVPAVAPRSPTPSRNSPASGFGTCR